MKRIMTLALAVLMVMAMGAVAFAADNTITLLGTWEVEFEGYGKFTIELEPDGVGKIYQDGQLTEQFPFMLRGDWFAGGEEDENGEFVFEASQVELKDDTLVMEEDGMVATFTRVAKSDTTEMNVDNAFIGTWIADLPEVPGMVMEYKADGTYSYKGGEYEGECSYFVWDNLMVSLSDEGECEGFTFEVVDENTMTVTEIATGAVVEFKRVEGDAQKAA